MPITSVHARQIYSNLGHPTLEVDITTDIGVFRASVPSALYAFKDEAKDLIDEDSTLNHGMSVYKAVSNINELLGPVLETSMLEVTQQNEIDKLLIKLDGTDDKSRLGANTILGLSIAVAKAGAGKRCLPLYRHLANLAGNKFIVLPVPALCMINGGNYAKNRLAMQEFMVLPTEAKSFNEAMEMGANIYYNLIKIIENQYGLKGTTVIGEEGGFAPNLNTAREALTLLNKAVQKANLKGKVRYAMNAAASEFYKYGRYDLDYKNPWSRYNQWLTTDQLLTLYKGLIKDFPLISIEDPFAENDDRGWIEITKTNIQIIGGDLVVSKEQLIQKALDKGICNCIRLKLNQTGTITELLQAQIMAKYNAWSNIISHRVGGTEDTFIADLAVGLSSGLIKSGPPRHGACLAKYNQLLRIEEELGKKGKYAGKQFRKVV